MGEKDPRVDAYIAKQADFAKPILERIRAVVHEACPGVEEDIKWGMPHFMYRKGILAGMAAFKAHAALGFWKGGRFVEAPVGVQSAAMGQFGRIRSLEDLPPKRTLSGYVRQAMKLKDQGGPEPRARRAPRKALPVPGELAAALRRNRAARATFESLSPSHRREYVEWITEAKREETRARRVGTTVEWLAEGRGLNWRYEKPGAKTAAKKK